MRKTVWNYGSPSGNVHMCILTYCYFVVVVYLLSCVWLFCNPMDCSLPGSSVHGISQANTRVGCHSLLQGIFPTQESNLHLLHWQVDSLPWCHEGSSDAVLHWLIHGMPKKSHLEHCAIIKAQACLYYYWILS